MYGQFTRKRFDLYSLFCQNKNKEYVLVYLKISKKKKKKTITKKMKFKIY